MDTNKAHNQNGATAMTKTVLVLAVLVMIGIHDVAAAQAVGFGFVAALVMDLQARRAAR